MSTTLKDSLNYSPNALSFGTSGLRDLVKDMTDLECYTNARGFINFLLNTNNIESGATIGIGGDLRPSTPRILEAVAQAIVDAGCKVVNLGKIPTAAAAYYGTRHDIAVAVVTGSHIPADRNGIKFYKREGEVLKEDEPAIKEAVSEVRQKLYAQPGEISQFTPSGELKQRQGLPKGIQEEVVNDFLERFTSLFDSKILSGKTIVVYQHSSIAADMLVDLLESLGAKVIPVDKSEEFIAIDTENITPENQAYFKTLAKKFPENFAIISADGDADRPFVIDETGIFHRGDVLGAVTAEFLGVKSAIITVSASDAVDEYLKPLGINVVRTKIGSPYIVTGMMKVIQANLVPAVGWEVNGGFLTGSNIKVSGKNLLPLATRDAFLPIACALVAATEKGIKISELFGALPQRFTQAGLIDNFPIETSKQILQKFSADSPASRSSLEKFFSKPNGFNAVVKIDNTDGMRMMFKNGDIAHVRPSGNAPQLRIYSVANSQKRANEIISLALAEPSGILRKLASSVNN